MMADQEGRWTIIDDGPHMVIRGRVLHEDEQVEVVPLARAEAAESHLARLEEAALKVRERADYLRYVWDNGQPGKDELEAIVRSIADVVAQFDAVRLAHTSPPSS